MRSIHEQTFSDAIKEHSDEEARHEQERYYSDEEVDMSDEEEPEIDESVQEDIERFEQSFQGITERFRLINRIGEGRVRLPSPSLDKHTNSMCAMVQAPFLLFTKPKTSIMITIGTTGTQTQQTHGIGFLRRSRRTTTMLRRRLTNGQDTSRSRRSMSQAALQGYRMSWNCSMT